MKKKGYEVVKGALAIVLILAMLIGGSPHVEAAAYNGIYVSGYSLTVSENRLGLNIFISGLSDADAVNSYATVEGEKLVPEKVSKGTYRVSLFVAPKDIDKVRTVALFVNNTKVMLANNNAVNGNVNVVVRDYLEQVKNQSDPIGRLAKAIEDYGDCARIYFEADTGEDTLSIATPEGLDKYKPRISGTLPEGIVYYGSSLILADTISIRHYFAVSRVIPDNELAGYSVTINGLAAEYVESIPGVFYIEVNGVKPGNIDKAYMVVISSSADTTMYTIDYSVLSYVYTVLSEKAAYDSANNINNADNSNNINNTIDTGNSYSAKLCSLVKAIYRYHEAFEEYLILNSSAGIGAYKNSKYTEDLGPAVIVVPSEASEEERYAAQLVQLAIKELDKYQPDIVNDATPVGSTGKKEISIGNTNRPKGNTDEISNDGYRIKAYDVGVAVTGKGARGVIDGAMELIRLCGGYFWLTWDDGMKSNQDCFKYSADIDFTYNRPFTFTDVDLNYWYGASGDNRLYSLYFGLNGTFANVQMENRPGYEKWYLSNKETYNGIHGGLYDYMQPGHAHTLLAEYFDESDLAAHPEWFVNPYDSSITWNNRQVCTSQDGVYNRIKERVFAMLDNPQIYNPDAPMQIICLSQSDNGVICHCKACKDFRAAHYWDTSDYQNSNPDEANAALYLDLCNRISGEIKAKGINEGKDYSNVYVDMLAYVSNKQPPVNMTVDDHVIVRFAPIERCYAHSLKESLNLNFGGDDRINGCYECNELAGYLKGWSELIAYSRNNGGGGQLWIWEYTVNFRDTYAPFPNIYSLIEDIRFYYELGVEGIYLQNSDRMNKLNSEYGDLRIYILSELLRNPEADVEKELEFFAHEYYGEGGEYMLETLEVLTQQARRHNVGGQACFPDFYPSWVGNYYLNNIVFRDNCMNFLAPVARIYNNEYPVEMDAQNGMSTADIEKIDELYVNALAAAAGDAYACKNIERTELGWRAVKSVMHAAEFSDSTTYMQRNKELYHDFFDTDKYGMTAFSLIYGGIPKETDRVLQHSPNEWLFY